MNHTIECNQSGITGCTCYTQIIGEKIQPIKEYILVLKCANRLSVTPNGSFLCGCEMSTG